MDFRSRAETTRIGRNAECPDLPKVFRQSRIRQSFPRAALFAEPKKKPTPTGSEECEGENTGATSIGNVTSSVIFTASDHHTLQTATLPKHTMTFPWYSDRIASSAMWFRKQGRPAEEDAR